MHSEKKIHIAQDDADALFTNTVIANLGRTTPEVWRVFALIRRYEGKISSDTRSVMASIIRSWVSNERDSTAIHRSKQLALDDWWGLADELLIINKEKK